MQLVGTSIDAATRATPDPLRAAELAGRRIVAFDGLRGVAAIMVLLHHSLLMLPAFANYQWFGTAPAKLSALQFLLLRTPLRLAWAGQERAILFFVLSGFVLALPWLNGKPFPYGRFLVGRFCRIYPPYILAMVLAAGGSILMGGHLIPEAGVYYNALGWAGRPRWNTITSILAVLTNRHSEYMNEAVWSLTWEVRIAFIFPLLILPIVRWRNLGVAGLYSSLFLAQHLIDHFGSMKYPDTIKLLGDTCLYAQYFVLGSGIALNRAAIGAWFGHHRTPAGWLCLTAGLLVCWAPWPRLHDEMVGVGAATVMVAILGTARLRTWLAHKIWIWLGRQSYSLYLVHVPIVMMTIILFKGKVPPVACLGVLPVAIACAQLFHRWIELPSVAWTQTLLMGRRPAGPRGVPDPAALDRISPEGQSVAGERTAA